MTYGSAAVPVPLRTPFEALNPASSVMCMGSCGSRAAGLARPAEWASTLKPAQGARGPSAIGECQQQDQHKHRMLAETRQTTPTTHWLSNDLCPPSRICRKHGVRLCPNVTKRVTSTIPELVLYSKRNPARFFSRGTSRNSTSSSDDKREASACRGTRWVVRTRYVPRIWRMTS